MARSSLALFIVCSCLGLGAQTYDADALRYALLNYSSTARSAGVSGAFGSVGADFSSIAINPAGLGVYRRSEITFTPGVSASKSISNYNGSSSNDVALDFGISNLGLVFSKVKKNKHGYATGLVSVAFAVGYSELANFSSKQTFNGVSGSSISQSYVDELNSNVAGEVNYDNFSFESVLAFDAWLANFQDTLGFYTSPVPLSVQQNALFEQQGGTNEVHIALATNLSNKIYLGGSLNLPLISYQRTVDFRESDMQGESDVFETLRVNQEYSTSGWGINAKFGAIYKPTKWMRVGAAIHTPTAMTVDEEFNTRMRSEFDTVLYVLESPLGVFDYQLRMPWRVTTGFSTLFKQYGFFSFDYELTDYSSMNYDFGSGNSDFEDLVNTLLDSKYGRSHQIRTGLEFAYEMFRLRAGYSYSTSPFRENVAVDDLDLTRQTYSAGIGFRKKKFFADLAYQRTHSKEFLAPYTLRSGGEPELRIENKHDRCMLTLGWKFGQN